MYSGWNENFSCFLKGRKRDLDVGVVRFAVGV